MPTPFSSPAMRRYPQCGFSRARRRISARNDDSSGARAWARMRIRPTAGDQVAVPAQERVRLHGEAHPGPPVAASGSAPPAAPDQLGSALAVQPAAARSPARGGGRGSPAPSSDAAVRAAKRARTGSARRDRRTTRPRSPLPRPGPRAPNLASPTRWGAADEFPNLCVPETRFRYSGQA